MRRKVKMGFEHQHRREPRFRLPPPSPEHRAVLDRQRTRDRYRVMVFARAVTPWASLGETQRAAIRAGHGSVCEQSGLLYMTVPAWLQRKTIDH